VEQIVSERSDRPRPLVLVILKMRDRGGVRFPLERSAMLKGF